MCDGGIDGETQQKHRLAIPITKAVEGLGLLLWTLSSFADSVKLHICHSETNVKMVWILLHRCTKSVISQVQAASSYLQVHLKKEISFGVCGQNVFVKILV